MGRGEEDPLLVAVCHLAAATYALNPQQPN